MSLQRIGCVLHIGPSKNAILKSEKLPRIGDKVVNEKLEPVGIVFDIFGPVISPYVSVKTQREDPGRLVGHVLYAIPSNSGKRRRKRR
ncbi:MAG: Gar1/Naf1 family protein [Candidatus Bathyarchaeia archaeon]